jgi:hypothetical protein
MLRKRVDLLCCRSFLLRLGAQGNSSRDAPSCVPLISHDIGRTRFAMNGIADDLFPAVPAEVRGLYDWLGLRNRIAAPCDSFVSLRKPCRQMI